MFDFGQKWAGGGGRVRFPLSPRRLSKFNSPHILPPLPAVRTQHDGYTCREELPLQALLVHALCFVNLAGPILWYFPIRPA